MNELLMVLTNRLQKCIIKRSYRGRYFQKITGNLTYSFTYVDYFYNMNTHTQMKTIILK